MKFSHVLGVGAVVTLAALSQASLTVASPEAPQAPGIARNAAALNAPVLRTPQMILQAEASGVRAPAPEIEGFPTTMNRAAYDALKAQLARAPQQAKPGTASVATLAPPVKKTFAFDGATASETGGFFPPDTHGAVGGSHFVEVTNSHIDIYSKSSPNYRVNGCATPPCPGVSLGSFFGYVAQSVFDPRAVYDPVYKRFVVTAEAFPESSTVQYFFIAVSQTQNPLGAWWIYTINAEQFGGAGSFYDYPQLGMDQDALIFTGNIFDAGNSFVGATMFTLAKARVYNGLGVGYTYFNGLCGTLAPPIVLDQNPRSFLACAVPGASDIQLYALRDSGRIAPSLSAAVTVPVAAYTVPPNAPQPGETSTTQELDTGDARFVNASTQNGDFLFNVHTIALGSFAGPRYYRINTATNAVEVANTFFKSGTSYDFNASIVANGSNDVFVTWSATDPTSTTFPRAHVRFGGHLSTDTPSIGAGTEIFNSLGAPRITGNTASGQQRWGDYSAISIDPSDPSKAWLVNEKVNGFSEWGTGIGRVGF